jgi:hypothetical protein
MFVPTILATGSVDVNDVVRPKIGYSIVNSLGYASTNSLAVAGMADDHGPALELAPPPLPHAGPAPEPLGRVGGALGGAQVRQRQLLLAHHASPAGVTWTRCRTWKSIPRIEGVSVTSMTS